MRMKKLLMFFVLLTVSLGLWAYTGSGTNITLSEVEVPGQPEKAKQVIETTQAGALATWFSSLTAAEKNEFVKKPGLKNLVISGPLNDADLAVLNTTTNPEWSKFETVDMSGVEEATIGQISAVNFSPATYTETGPQGDSHEKDGPGATYIRLPNSMTSAEDVAIMRNMKNGKNSNLKMVGAYDPDNAEVDNPDNKWAKVSMHSFEVNNVTQFINAMSIPTIGTAGQGGFIEPHEIRMSGEYGVNDLVNGTTPNFGFGTSAEWDFTGAHFADCTIPAITAKYYNYDNPFCDPDVKVAPFTTTDQDPNVTTTNAFYYFSNYCKSAIDVKLPDNNMTHLPTNCFDELAKTNSSGYIAKYGQDAYNANKLDVEGVNCVPIDKLVIPDCYTDLDQECAVRAHIRHLVVGEGVKRVHGGAFVNCDYLEDLDFAPGISDCYLGDNAFNQCSSMKHIQLSEGIVSLGANCFDNSQHLESIRLPETLKYIGNHCFHKCYALSTITIPENVEKIGQAAFYLCGLTDIYLTTKDPAKVPLIYTHGRGFNDTSDNGTFYRAHYNGIMSCPNEQAQHPDFTTMTWDEATAWYYSHCNLIATLHFPEELTDKVRADLCDLYDFRCEVNDGWGYGLPSQYDAETTRGNIEGNFDANGNAIYSSDGWAQFALMKKYSPNSNLFEKKYADEWYTMCFPFDLTDEQLAAAFNEKFNIVDFSGVEIRPATETEKKTLVLHFNNVAETTYKDDNNNIYVRKRDGEGGLTGNVVREVDESSEAKFEYNVYYKVVNGTPDTSVEYHHVNVGTGQAKNFKTKTFAAGGNAQNEILLIDGYLASAGHPYMIHPSTGAEVGSPKVRCYFSGVSWKLKDSETGYDGLYESEARTVDLGGFAYTGSRPATVTYSTTENFQEENFDQAPYQGYEGQTYTFIGNWKAFTNGDEAAIEKPDKADYVNEPARPEPPTVVEQPTETLPNPGITLSSSDIDIYRILSKYVWTSETEIIYELEFDESNNPIQSDGYDQYNLYNGQKYRFNNDKYNMKPYGTQAEQKEAFNKCKNIFNNYHKLEAYNKNQRDWAAYNRYLTLQQEYEDALTYYNNWTEEYGLAEYNKALAEYNNAMANKTPILIPENAYFLGKGANDKYPKYYRETSKDQTRKTGLWSQYSAIIIPNGLALNGIEKGVEPQVPGGVKGYNIAWNEDYEGEFDPTEIKDIIAKAEEKGQKVEYMNIVYSINGEIISRDTQSLSNLPKGMYIINGKKYLVK